MRAIAILGACLILAGLSSADEGGKELLGNPRFREEAKGWSLQEATAAEPGHGESASVRLVCKETKRGHDAHVSTVVRHVPENRELRFTCFVRGGRRGQPTMAQAIGSGEGGKRTAHARQWITLTGDAWDRLAMTFAVPPGTEELRIEVSSGMPGPVLVSDAHLVAGAEQVAPLYELGGAGVLRATAWAGVRAVNEGGNGVVTFPIPGTYRDQVPLTFTVESDPPQALRGYRWIRRPDGLNWLCEVSVAPPGAGAVVGWEALVLVGAEDHPPLPKADKPEVPDQAKAWTRATACVQSDDPDIRAKAAALAEGADDLEAYVRRVMTFTSKNDGKPGAPFRTLDARQALDCGGSCTSRANLAAALLRARGIPARTLAHLPTWSGPLYEHWLVEYWHPGVGWVWLETSYDRFRPQPWTLAALSVAGPDDEDEAFDPLQCRFVAPGAPHRSVHVESEGLLEDAMLKTRSGRDNLAEPMTRLAGDPAEVEALFAGARAAFERLSEAGQAGRIDPGRAETIRRALRAGKAAELRQAVSRKPSPRGTS